MENKAPLRFMLLFLAFSYLLLSSSAVPSTRSLKSIKELSSSSSASSAVQDLLPQAVGLFHDAVSIEDRMLMESTDYPGTGANKNHDPKTPGRA